MERKNNLLKACAVLAALIMSAPALVRADDEEGNGVGERVFSIGPRAAFFTPKGDAMEDKWYGGLQMRLRLIPMLALEASVDYRKQDFKLDTSLQTYPVQASLLMYLFPRSRIAPFILAGGGWYFTTFEGPGDFSQTDDRFGGHAGGGLEWRLGKSVSLDASYRYIWMEKLNVHNSQTSNVLDKQYDDSGSQTTIGLNFLF